MRIIGGDFKGRKIDQPDIEQTRPVADRAKEAIFNVLGDIEDLRVLDLYAGSGAFALESISRGAQTATAVDASVQATQIIQDNASNLGVDARVSVVHAPVGRWLMQVGASFDLVFADPPFDAFDHAEFASISSNMNEGGTFVLKHHRRIDSPDIDGLTLQFSRRYASTEVSFYKK